MPYNGSGVFTPATPPRQPNTTILSADYNSDLNDLSSGLSNAVTRDGQGAMSTQFKLIAGTVTVPGLGFSAATATGIYMPSSTSMAFPVQGGEAMRLTLDGADRNVLIGQTSSTGERLQVAGNSKFTGDVEITGETTFSGPLTLNGSLKTAGDITIEKANPLFAAKATSGSALLDLDSAASQPALVRNKRAGVIRWTAGLDASTDDYAVSRYSSTGTLTDAPLRVEAAVGRVVVNSLYSPGSITAGTTVNGAGGLFTHGSGAQVGITPDSNGSSAVFLRTVGIGATTSSIYATNVTTGFTSWGLTLRNGQNGNSFDVLRFNPTTGVYVDNPININSASGVVTLNSTVINSGLTLNGSGLINGGLTTTGNLSTAAINSSGASGSINLNRTSSSGVNSVGFYSGGVGIWDYRTTADPSAHLLINRFDGSAWQTSMQINRLNGAFALYGPTTVTSTLHANGALTTSSAINAAGTIGGSGIVARANASYGYTTLQSGGTATSGYVEFVAPNNVRQGYIGNSGTFAAGDLGNLEYNAGTHRFFGTVYFNNTIQGNISGTSAGAPWGGISGRPIIEHGTPGGASWWTNTNGVITQTWQVSISIPPSTIVADTFTFPRSFPNGCTNVQITAVNSTGLNVISVTSWSQFAVAVRARDYNTANTGVVTLFITAVGI